MKTAMQELIDNLNDINQAYNNKLPLMIAIREAEKLLKKEKKQIIKACNANLSPLLTNGEDYYNLTYTQ